VAKPAFSTKTNKKWLLLEAKKKPVIKVYTIFTTKEQASKTYSTQDIKIDGSFTSFRPCIEIRGKEEIRYSDNDDFWVILPQSAIKEIRYIDQTGQ